MKKATSQREPSPRKTRRLRAELLELIERVGPISPSGVALLLGGEVSRQSASQALRRGLARGVFEELPGAPGVYRAAS